MDERQCSRCGVTYVGSEVEAFFRSGVCAHTPRRWLVCKACAQTARDDRKRQNRELSKARSTFYNHADKYVRAGLVTSRTEFADRYGWDVHQMAHDIEHAYGNGCPYCNERFLSMGHGLADITLDIADPSAPPYYATNVRWVCGTCNREKQRTRPPLWGANLAAWRRWRTRPAWPDGSLFGDWGSP